MKRIVILTCLKASRVCTGAACFQAFHQRTRSFVRYGKESLEIEAFMRCSGCGHTMENDKGLQEKVERILEIHPDAVHLGICCCHDGRGKELCEEIQTLANVFAEHGIEVVRGTHSEF